MGKRILVVSPTPTHPVSAGNRARIVEMLKNLQGMGHDVHFAHIQREFGDDVAMERCWGKYFHTVPFRRRSTALRYKATRKLKSLFDPGAVYTFGIDEWFDPGVDEFLRQLQRQYRFEVVIVNYVFFSKALECFEDNILKIIDTHDVFTDRYKLYLENGRKPTWFSTTRRQEAKGLNRADFVIAIQELEREFFSGICEKEIVTVSHSVALVKPEDRKTSNKLLFVGSRNPINVESLQKFMSEVWPLVHSQVPEALLCIAGSVCDEIEPIDGLVVLGSVESLAEAYSSADIVINPILYGTGLKIKNIEALGYARPLITTPVGAEGLEAGVGTAFQVADTADEWVRLIVDMLGNGKSRQTLSKQAYEFARLWNENVKAQLAQTIKRKPHSRKIA